MGEIRSYDVNGITVGTGPFASLIRATRCSAVARELSFDPRLARRLRAEVEDHLHEALADRGDPHGENRLAEVMCAFLQYCGSEVGVLIIRSRAELRRRRHNAAHKPPTDASPHFSQTPGKIEPVP